MEARGRFLCFPSVCFATSPLRAVPGHRFFGLPREPPPGAAGWPTGTVGSQVVVKSKTVQELHDGCLVFNVISGSSSADPQMIGEEE